MIVQIPILFRYNAVALDVYVVAVTVTATVAIAAAAAVVHHRHSHRRRRTKKKPSSPRPSSIPPLLVIRITTKPYQIWYSPLHVGVVDP